MVKPVGVGGKPAHYFDPDTIDRVARRHLDKPMPAMAEAIGRDLKALYPNLVDENLPLVFTNSGGILYQLKIFAMTPREYIMICGSSIGSSGFSGRHPAAFWDTVLSGRATYMCQDQWEPDAYSTGDRIFVDRWQAAAIEFPDHCWMLEYARGSLIWLLPFGMIHVFTSTLDFRSLFRLMRVYGALTRRYFRAHPEEMRPYALAGGLVGGLLVSALWWSRRVMPAGKVGAQTSSGAKRARGAHDAK